MPSREGPWAGLGLRGCKLVSWLPPRLLPIQCDDDEEGQEATGAADGDHTRDGNALDYGRHDDFYDDGC